MPSGTENCLTFCKNFNMTDVNKIKEEIRKNVMRQSVDTNAKGGQTVGRIMRDIKISSEELGLTITLGYSRSQHWNHEMAMKLFNLALDWIVMEEIEQLPTEVYGPCEEVKKEVYGEIKKQVQEDEDE